MNSESEGESLDFHPHPEEDDDSLGPLCPTCKGHGVVDENAALDTIALIPANDKRLKPKRTNTYITVAVIVTISLCAAGAFLLWQRAVSIHLLHAEIVDYNITSESAVTLTAVIVYEARNENYFAVSMDHLLVEVEAPENVGQFNSNTSFSVAGRDSHQLSFQTTISFYGDHAEQIIKQCAKRSSWNHFMLILSTTINWHYLSSDKGQLQNNDWDCFTCRHGTFPGHGKIHECLPNTTAPFLPIGPAITIPVTMVTPEWKLIVNNEVEDIYPNPP